MGPDASAIHAVVEPILAQHAMELVELSCRPHGGQLHVRLLVDRVGGVTIQQCAQVNQRIGEALEGAALIEGSYTIEVSSPGLDRPLASRRDFERALGEDLRVDVSTEDGRSREVTGMLLAVQHEAIVVKTGSGNVTVPFGAIRFAKKALKW
jgi:ribosome maturation factor RimP